MDIGITRPERGSTIVSGTTFQIQFTVMQPEGAPAPDLTRLEYCVDFRASAPLMARRCQDPDGFKPIGDVDTNAAGDYTFDWNVPRTGQGDNRTGAVRARLNPDDQNVIETVDGITFR